jgi:uncharacterized protein YkwD
MHCMKKLIAALILILAPFTVTNTLYAVDTQQAMIDNINYYRSLNGLRPLLLDRAWGTRFQYWCDEMARAGSISHDYGRLTLRMPSNATVFENVGSGASVWAVYNGFVNSAPHRGSMLVPNAVRFGSCVTVRNGVTYTVNRFSTV